jgi:hypothetical protein
MGEEVVTVLVISHAACFFLGGFIGLLFAAICAMASDKYPRGTTHWVSDSQLSSTSNFVAAPAWGIGQKAGPANFSDAA